MPKNDIGTCTLVTASGSHQLEVRLANNVLKRFCGLMFRGALHSRQGLLLTRCSSVHSAFMRHPIDVVYVDRDGVVTKCVRGLQPWGGSFGNIGKDESGRRFTGAAHALELAAGAIDAIGIALGDRLLHPHWERTAISPASRQLASAKQRGSSMIEFTVVGPIISMLGLTVLQYSMLFFAKGQINYAGFMAAREGAMAHADILSVQQAYVRALVPLYGGGQTPAELANSLAKATADLGPNGAGNLNIELINPTSESFADWNDPALQQALNTGGKRVIPNAGQAFKSQAVGATSGQTIQDANIIKLRITQGYLPKIPFVSKLYTTYLKWLDPHTDAFHTKLVDAGRIPVVTNVTMQMQSDVIEPATLVSMPGAGNNGVPNNPGTPPVSNNPPPDCSNAGCATPAPAPAPEPPPACNVFTDPNHCQPPDCSMICCAPT
jgi:uncharacterized membrane protein (UPF0127 family)/Flp pilus assembly protein TadG